MSDEPKQGAQARPGQSPPRGLDQAFEEEKVAARTARNEMEFKALKTNDSAKWPISRPQ